MDLELLVKNSLKGAVVEAFSMASLAPAETDNNCCYAILEGINSSIFLKGDIAGKANILASNASACQIVSKMLFSEIKSLNSEVIDGMGELINVITGGMKSRLYKEGYHFEISVPSTTCFSVLRENSLKGYNVTEQCFACEGTDITFMVRIAYSLKKKDDASSASEEKPKMSAADLLNSLIQKQKGQ